jgi:predicted peptidase
LGRLREGLIRKAGFVLDRVLHDYRIDADRIYITGHSMGG